jgi:hypothetical protein
MQLAVFIRAYETLEVTEVRAGQIWSGNTKFRLSITVFATIKTLDTCRCHYSTEQVGKRNDREVIQQDVFVVDNDGAIWMIFEFDNGP